MQYLFLDTNIFIHCIDFEQIDWRALSECDDDFTIMIAPVVMDELDKHKRNANQKIAKRVKKVQSKIEGIIESPEKGQMRVTYIMVRPLESTFSSHYLSRQDQDDNVLATILEFIAKTNNGDSVLLFTNDLGPRLKAKTIGISARSVPDQYMVVNEVDEVEIKNRELQKELNEFKNRAPVVSLLFKDHSTLLTHCYEATVLTKDEFIAKAMQKVERENPPLFFVDPDKDNGSSLAAIASLMRGPFPVRKDQVDQFNESMKDYFAKYRECMAEYYDVHIFHQNMVSIKLLLANTGTAPAENIDIELHFPDGFELIDKEGLPEKPNLPSVPHRPKHGMDFGLNNLNLGALYQPRFGNGPTLDFNAPTITKTNS